MVVTPLRMDSRNDLTWLKSAWLAVLGSRPSAISASGTTSSAPSSRLVRPLPTYFGSAM